MKLELILISISILNIRNINISIIRIKSFNLFKFIRIGKILRVTIFGINFSNYRYLIKKYFNQK
jgi:hypothetical protein